MKRFLMTFFYLSFLIYSAQARSEVLSFEKVWSEISSDSPMQQSSRLETEAAEEATSIANRHWLPRIYLGIQGYQTDNPGAAFFGVLSQRALTQADFNPNSINHPDSHFYTQGALGLDLALFEGGSRSAQADMQKHFFKAQQSTQSQLQLDQYAQAGLSYASIIVIDQQKKKVAELNVIIQRLLKKYQLGSKSNPLGYSGLLGMKSLANRLEGLAHQFDAQERSLYAVLASLGLKKIEWQPQTLDVLEFADKYFVFKDSKETSYKIEALREKSFASQDAARMARGRYLPKLGVFAEKDLFHGSRDTANSYMAGVYLQWNLFNPADYGTYHESQLRAQAAQFASQAMSQQEDAQKISLNESIKALRENIRLLKESYDLLTQQTKTTETLFRNGSINVLQFIEVLSRRADVIAQENDVQINFLKTTSQAMSQEKHSFSEQNQNGSGS